MSRLPRKFARGASAKARASRRSYSTKGLNVDVDEVKALLVTAGFRVKGLAPPVRLMHDGICYCTPRPDALMVEWDLTDAEREWTVEDLFADWYEHEGGQWPSKAEARAAHMEHVLDREYEFHVGSRVSGMLVLAGEVMEEAGYVVKGYDTYLLVEGNKASGGAG